MKRRRQHEERVTKHLKVGCAKPFRDDDSNPPGLFGNHVPSPPDCTATSFPLSKAIIRHNTTYCSEACADFGHTWITQHQELAAAETNIIKLQNGWAEDNDCDICNRCEYDDAPTFWNERVFGQRTNFDSLCGICAMTINTNIRKQNRWALPSLPLPDGWQSHVFDFGNGSKAYECTLRGPNCNAMTWCLKNSHCLASFHKLVDEASPYCVACMEDDEYQTRKIWWNKSRHVIVETELLIDPLVAIVAEFLISAYIT